MGAIADSLRSSLRDLAEADARLYRGLAEELATIPPAPRRRALSQAGRIQEAIRLLEANGYRVTKG